MNDCGGVNPYAGRCLNVCQCVCVSEWGLGESVCGKLSECI